MAVTQKGFFAYFWEREKRQLGRPVAMETKEQDVSHRGMVTSGSEHHCVAYFRYNYTTQGQGSGHYGNLKELQSWDMWVCWEVGCDGWGG